jgi:hypothetical protein
MGGSQFASFVASLRSLTSTQKVATIPLKNSGKVACILRNSKTFSKVSVMRPNKSLKLTL